MNRATLHNLTKLCQTFSEQKHSYQIRGMKALISHMQTGQVNFKVKRLEIILVKNGMKVVNTQRVNISSFKSTEKLGGSGMNGVSTQSV